MRSAIVFGCLLLFGCVGVPAGVAPVERFELERYLGTWYEIARLDHAFERGLERVSARYSRRPDGGITVVNTGFDPRSGKWKTATGRAYPVGPAGTGRLKVSFFGPFFGGYNILALDPVDYGYALVCGPTRKYLWILARRPVLATEVKTALVQRAADLGFATSKLIYVRH